jgi:hypothetical protein
MALWVGGAEQQACVSATAPYCAGCRRRIMFLAEAVGIAWVVGWFLLYTIVILSAIYTAIYLIFKIIDFIRKELE